MLYTYTIYGVAQEQSAGNLKYQSSRANNEHGTLTVFGGMLQASCRLRNTKGTLGHGSPRLGRAVKVESMSSPTCPGWTSWACPTGLPDKSCRWMAVLPCF